MLLIAALIAFLAVKLPMHPFDYIYNKFVAKLLNTKIIPGRGSELQVNSTIALVFNLIVFVFISFGVSINFALLSLIYTFCSLFFIVIFLLKN
jgi:hypothetical protein